MGYSRNPSTLRKIEGKLEPLARGQACSWTITSGSPEAWAYKVREALSIAYRHRDKFPALAAVARRVKVIVLDERTVQAVIEESERSEMAVLTSPQLTIPMHGVNEGAGPVRTLVSPQSAADVIEHWIRTQPSNDPLRILQADLDEDQKEAIQKFAQSRTPAWILLESVPGALVIAPSTPDIPPGAVWKRRTPSSRTPLIESSTPQPTSVSKDELETSGLMPPGNIPK